ncbi:MAG: hypothetical protein J7J98_07570 [candidate division Zixibacteria bacterium]|nr:hypothetical protein [candidate division Zixibacteria bacterium]
MSVQFGSNILILIGIFLLAPASEAIELQRSDSTEYSVVDESFEGWIIDSIEIDNRNIYDLENKRYQGYLFRTANRLHVVTREWIVRQELLFAVGDRLAQSLIEETARNLRLRFPLNDARIEVLKLATGRVLVRVVTVDQWSLIGGVRSISLDGNETNFQIGFEERNLIGRAQFLSFDFFARGDDPNYVQLTYREPRVLGHSVGVGLYYRTDPTNSLKQAEITRPYYSLAQNLSFDISVAEHSCRVERLNPTGDVIAQWTSSGETVRLNGGYRVGPSYRKTLIYGDYKYLYKAVVGDSEYGVDSVYHRFTVGLAQAWQEFIIEKRIRGFGYTEDFALGLSLGISYGRAFLPGFRGYLFDKAHGKMSGRWKLGHNLLGAEYSRIFWFKGSNEIRRQYGLTLTLYNNQWHHATWAVRSRYLFDRDGENLNVILGGENGLRGYPSESLAGDRSHVVNIESRLFFGLELLSVKIGSALFVDIGRTWQPDETLAFRDYHLSGGAGLRLSLENFLKGEIIRVDVILAEGGNWELSFGTGQYF